MRTVKLTIIALAAFTLGSCEAGDINVQDFLNDFSVNVDNDNSEADWVCGDGWIDPNEECDDGNIWDGDGCSSSCTIEERGCYDEFGKFHNVGEYWSYYPNEECTCYSWGEWGCWGWDYDTDSEDGCEIKGVFYSVGESVYLSDGSECKCAGGGMVDCGGNLLVIV